jgi:hypothetical protein
MTEILTIPDSLDDALAFLYDLGGTDGLPVVPPTPDRVEKMLAAAGGDGSAVIAQVPPLLGEATLDKIAANAVMAGCLPEYMPVLVAAIRAMCRSEFNLAGIQGTGDPVAPGLILNGPVRAALDVNCGENAAGPGRRANAAIGRAVRLVLINIGGATPGVIDRAMLGQPAKYTFCLGENEEHSPWEPFHTARGVDASQSAVSVVAVEHCQFIHPITLPPETLLQTIADAMCVVGHSKHFFGPRPVTLFIPPAQASLLDKLGFTKEKVKEFLFERARIRMERLPKYEDAYYWSGYVNELEIHDGSALVVSEPDDILVYVVGGLDYGGVLYLGGWDARPTFEPIESDSLGGPE